jgi:hypothetical protein
MMRFINLFHPTFPPLPLNLALHRKQFADIIYSFTVEEVRSQPQHCHNFQ